MYEYLPAFVGQEVSKYQGYKAYVHPGISHVFQSAAFRYDTSFQSLHIPYGTHGW